MLKVRFFAPLASRTQNDREEKRAIAIRLRWRSNLIFILVKKFLSTFTFNFLLLTFIFAQETYNLEVIFKKTHEPTVWYEGFGQALSTAGDVNGDGYDDILIGSPSGEVRGRCYLYLGGNPMDTILDMTFYGDTAGDGFAVSVCSGFLNDDSFSEIVVGIPNGWVNGNQPGKVYVYFGGSGLDTIPDIVFKGENNTEAFGYSVACGDINGDGWDDLVVGAYCYPNSFVGHGRLYVYYGGPLLDTIPDVIINGHNGESMGITVGSGGDVNSDGYEDIVAGAFNNDEAGTWAGKVYVFLGGNPMDTVPDCWLHGEGRGHFLGWQGVGTSWVSDNHDAVITGTQFYPNGFPGYSPGKVYVLYGGSPMDTVVDLWKVGETDSSGLGIGVAGAKVDANTIYGDFLAGAPQEYQFDGRGYLWIGNNSIDSVYDAWLQGNINYYGIGWRGASAGDVNGDGFDEVMFSNYAADSNQTVWVCRYVGPAVAERSAERVGQSVEIYPNPFSKLININFGIEQSAEGTVLKIYDATGRLVKSFNRSAPDPLRPMQIIWQGDDDFGRKLPTGVYFIKVESGGISEIRKVVKVR